MNEKLSEINKQLETLTSLINEYQESLLQERVIITKDDFPKIDHLEKIYEKNVLDFNNGMIFILMHDNSNSYSCNTYKKLMSKELDQIILNKIPVPYKLREHIVTYELESQDRTKLKELYPEVANS